MSEIFKNLGFYDPKNLENLFDDDSQRESFQRMTTDWNALASLIGGGKTMLTELLGVEEAFFVLNMRGPAPFYLAIPKTGKLNPEMIRQAIPSGPELLFHEIPGFLLIVPDWNRLAGKSEEQIKRFLNQVAPKKPKADSRILEALESVKEYPVRLALAPPEYFAKVLRDTRPMLTPPLERVDLALTAENFRWFAAGIDPVQLEFACHVEAASEPAAVQLRQTAEVLADAAFGAWQEYVRSHENKMPTATAEDFVSIFNKSLSELSTPENFEQLKSVFLPQPQGNRWIVQIDRDRISKYTELAIPFGLQIIELANAEGKRSQCVNNLKSLAIAMHNYHDTYGHFPPTFSVDENGKPLQSWRVLLLPFLENSALYEAIRRDEPWDSEHNRQFHDKMPPVFRCAQCRQGKTNRDTVYCVVVGDETFGRAGERGIKLGEITDGTSNTFMIVERKKPVCWMAPVDISQEDAYLGVNQKAEGIGSGHEGGFNAAIGDGSVRFISEKIALDVLKAILTVAGGESQNF